MKTSPSVTNLNRNHNLNPETGRIKSKIKIKIRKETLAPLNNTPPTLLGPPAGSSLAYGLNIGTVVNIQNHWREYYNPIRAIDMDRAIALYDFRSEERRVGKECR